MADRKRTDYLSNVDTAWLRMEHPTNLMMITGVMMFDEPIDFERLKATVEHGLLQPFPRFRQRLVGGAKPVSPPRWEDDPHFDIRAHVRRIALPAPGDDNALQELVSDLMSTPLDFSKPLWQWHLVENYGSGCALIARLHHCIADGIALVHVMLSMTQQEADAPPPPPASPNNHRPQNALSSLLQPANTAVQRTRHASEMLWHEGMELLTNPARMLDLVQLGTSSAAALGKLLLMGPDPKTVFRGKLGVTKRAVWSVPIPLDEIKAIGHIAKSTINDILLTTVTGALRHYLQSQGKPVDGVTIRAVVPVNLRPLGEVPELGNRFGLVFLGLPIGIADPLDRLIELQERMDAIKGSPEAVVAFGILNAMGMAPSEIENIVVNIFGTKATTVMTNVPGPRQILYMAGKPIRGIMFWVPQSGRLGLGVSILSYANEVRLGIATDAGLVPDPEKVIAGFYAEFEQLKEMAQRAQRLEARRQQVGSSMEKEI